MTLAERLKKGVISQEEHDVLAQAAADKAVANEAQEWLEKVKAAPAQVKKQLVKDQALNMQIEASIMEDRFEAKAKQKRAWDLRKSLRGAGGVTF